MRGSLAMCAFVLIIGAVFCISCKPGDDDSSDDSFADDEVQVDDDSASGDDTGVFWVDDTSTGDDDTTLPDWITIPAGQMTVRIRTNPYAMEIRGPDDQMLVATVEPDKGINISPMPFLPHAFAVGDYGHDWFYAKEVIAYGESGDDKIVTVKAVDQETGTRTATLWLTFRTESDNHLSFTATTSGIDGVKYHVGAYKMDSDERFFGLGLQKDSLDSRGKMRNMFIGIGVNLTDQIQNHASMPFYISSRGYGLFVEEKGHGYFDMGSSDANAWGYKYRTESLKTHIFWGPNPLDIIESYTALTGRPPMNPDYLFGYLHWRNDNNSGSEVYDDADALRAHGIPCSSIMVDAPWQKAYSDFQFNDCPSGCQFSDAQAMIDYVHHQGYAFYLWTAEFVNRVESVEKPGMLADNSQEFNYAKNHGYLISVLGLIYEIKWWHDNGAMVNFFNPAAYDWYKGMAANVMAMGAQGFKMDGGEYPGAETLGLWPSGAFDYGGYGDSNTAGYYYKWKYHQLFWEVAHEYNGDLAVSTVRCASWGEQVHINYFWPGDLHHGWDTELGLPADIIGGLNLSTAGFPYYGSNNAGFSDYGPDDPELFARWTEYSAFRPIFEGARDGTADVWEIYPSWMEPLFRKYVVMHTRLFPYMKAYAYEATQTGHPIMRMLPLVFMDDPVTHDRNFDYMLGDWLLVAPVYVQGQTQRDVYLPAGKWVQYWTGVVHDGPDWIYENAPVDTIPVYAKAGAIIPLLDPSIQSFWVTDNPDIIGLADVANLMWADVFPFGSSSFTIVDGTTFSQAQSGGGFTFDVANAPMARTYSLRAVTSTYGGGAPSSVTGPSGVLAEYASYGDWNAAANGWFYDTATGELWIRDTCTNGTFAVN